MISLNSILSSNRKSSLSMLVIIGLMVAIAWVHVNNKYWTRQHKVIMHDVVGYYSYLPAAIIYGDLTFSFFDEYPDYFYSKMYKIVAPNGGYYQKVTMGLAFLYLPFFLMGHFVAWIGGYEMSGYSSPYLFFLLLSSAFYLLLGLLVLRKILLQFSKDWVVALVIPALVLAAQMFHYTTTEATMPHIYNFTIFVLFIWFTQKWYENRSYRYALILGLLFGLISLIRPTNALIAIFFILYDVKTTKEFLSRPSFFLQQWKHILIIVVFSFTVWLPQMIFWKVNTDMWFFYSYEGEGFFFLNPQLINGFFSYRKGWLLYTPLMIPALIGIVLLYKTQRRYFLAILTFTLLNIYIVFSWWAWWYGGGFGIRPMIDSYAFMAIALAAFISYTSAISRKAKYIVVAVMLLLTAHGIYQHLQYHYGSIHWDSMSKAAYWHSMGRLRPAHGFYDLLEPPDYEKAKLGIQATRIQSKTVVTETIFCNYEELTPDSTDFFCDKKQFLFGSARLRSNEMARSGEYSIKLSPDAPYGSSIEILAKKNDHFQLSVWKYPGDAEGRIVFSDPNAKTLYRNSRQVVETDEDGWARIELNVKIPDTLQGFFRIYLWNQGQEAVYFDDFEIKKTTGN